MPPSGVVHGMLGAGQLHGLEMAAGTLCRQQAFDCILLHAPQCWIVPLNTLVELEVDGCAWC